MDAEDIKHDDDLQITVRHIMQGKEVGSIIGKSGETVKKLREESGSKIYISDSSTPERIVTVIGSMDSLFRAFSLITKNIEEFHKNQNKHLGGNGESQLIQLRLIVPASQCGSIIGKGGSQIKTIRETSGASVYVASDMLPNSTEREVNIKGVPDAVTQAIYQICLIMVDSPPKGATIPYRPLPQNAGGPGLIGNQFGMQNSLMGAPDMGNNPLAGLAALGLGGNSGGGMGGGLNAAALAALASSQLKTNHMPRNQNQNQNQHNRNNRDGPSQKTNQQQNQITKEMTVPNELIGAVIGKGGTKIFEIRKISGAMIRISKSSEEEEDSNDRTITMTGTPDAIALAQYLINMSVELLRANLNGEGGGESNMDDFSSDNNLPSSAPLAGLNASNPLAAALPQLAQILTKPGALNALTSLSALGGLSDLLGGGSSGGGSGNSGGFGGVPQGPNYANIQTTGVQRRSNFNKNRNNPTKNGTGRSNPYPILFTMDAEDIKHDDDLQITVRHIMQGKEVGSIIGKSGETVKKLREESGSKIYISDSSTPERIVTVIGSMDSLFRAFSLITKNIEEFHKNQNKHLGGNGESQLIQLRLIVPASQCGSIIGKGGSQIKTIRETSGASVYVASDMLPNSTEREVNIKGVPDAVTQAIYQICLIMVDSPPKGATIPYRPLPQNAGGPGLIGNQFGMQNSLMGAPDMGNNPLAGLAALGLGGNSGGGMGGGLNAAALAALASSQLKTNHMPRNQNQNQNQHNRNNRDGPSQKTNQQQNQITKEMTVPNELIGAVIGKGGTKIFEIRKISGAMIRISKSSEEEEDSNDRTITMTGTPDAIALAQYLINMSVELLRANLNGEGGGESNMDDFSSDNNLPSSAPLAGLNASNPLAAALPQLAQILTKPGALNAL
ncbi:far upstream element-binding protein 2-like [Diaphorina citri]|uniref:Far upstream element-binding protein 2-like n=1 Tax=Diaphorina citri TaxID=121845 RepID=A0A3Q0J523_DIACI|nr:far upstream element-binding protein 2-like [Diaphorina citri]